VEGGEEVGSRQKSLEKLRGSPFAPLQEMIGSDDDDQGNAINYLPYK
jgi:hypothetical protein